MNSFTHSETSKGTIARPAAQNLDGIIPSLITPFDREYRVDLDAMGALVRFLLHSGVHGLYLTGSVGEWVRLTPEERKSIVEAVISEVEGQVPVAVHVGHHSTATAVDLCRHARACGADYVASVIPGYYRQTQEELISYYRALADVGVPVIVYFLEGQSGNLDLEAMISELSRHPGVAGVKYTSADFFLMQRVFQISEGRLRVWGGHDQMALAALTMDACGVIGAHYNYIPEVYVEMYQAFRANDLALARALQSEANRIIAAVKHFGYLRSYKATLDLRGLPVGDCRPPSAPFTPEERKALAESIAGFGDRFGPITVR